MADRRKSPKVLRILLPLGIGAAALLAFSKGPAAQMSELDAFQRAINTQSTQDALAFIDDYGSSHLVPDLIDLLEPDVAAQVCSSVRSPSSRVRGACERVQRDVATAPAASTATTTPAAKPTVAPAIAAPAAPAAASTAPAVKPTTAPAASGTLAKAPAPTIAKTPPPTPAPAPTTDAATTAGKPTTTPTAASPAAAPTAAIAQAPLPAPTPAPAPASPSFEVVVPAKPTTATVTAPASTAAQQSAAIPPIEQDSAAPPADSKADTLRDLTARFDRGPFTIDHLDRDRGEMVVTYAGQLANYVACGDAVGSVGLAPAAIDSTDRLNSRMIIRLADGSGGSTRVSVDTIHIVSLRNPASQSLDVLNLRLDDPATTSSGDYCWSTGEMERLAQLN